MRSITSLKLLCEFYDEYLESKYVIIHIKLEMKWRRDITQRILDKTEYLNFRDTVNSRNSRHLRDLVLLSGIARVRNIIGHVLNEQRTGYEYLKSTGV